MGISCIPLLSRACARVWVCVRAEAAFWCWPATGMDEAAQLWGARRAGILTLFSRGAPRDARRRISRVECEEADSRGSNAVCDAGAGD